MTTEQLSASNRVLSEVLGERWEQHEKWGEQGHSGPYWLTILTEEIGEFARTILENDPLNSRKELIQVAAVAVQIIECLDRGNI